MKNLAPFPITLEQAEKRITQSKSASVNLVDLLLSPSSVKKSIVDSESKQRAVYTGSFKFRAQLINMQKVVNTQHYL